MAVDNTLLLREVDSIIENGDGIRHSKIECTLRVGSEWITPTRTTIYTIERDYEDSYGDISILEVLIGLGDYAYKIVPKQDNILVDLTITPYYRGTDKVQDTKRRTVRYRGIMMEQENPGLVGKLPYSGSRENMNIAGHRNVQFQLINEALFQVRMNTIGGLYRNVIPATLLKSVLTDTNRFIDSNKQQQIFGVDMVGGFNNTPRQHIIIPHGTPLIKLSRLLQFDQGGIYGAGIGCYLQDGYWYVFPTHDTTRWNKNPYALTVLNVPSNRYFAAERTYRYTQHQVSIVVAGDSDSQDNGLYKQLNEGNGYRFTNTNNLLTMGTTEQNKTTLSRKDNLYEFEGYSMEMGKKNIQWGKEGATSNPFKYYSELAKRNGRYISVQWLHGDASLLYPGMPVKYMSTVNGALATFYGVLLGVQEQRIPKEGGVVSEHFASAVQLKLFLARLNVVI